MSEQMDILGWLTKSGCQQYHNKFAKNKITVDLLPELDTEALREIGVVKVGDRLRLELAIAELKLHMLKSKVSLDEIKKSIQSSEADLETRTASSEKTITGGAAPLRIVTFILPDGSLKKVNVEGCFNAELIKRKVLKKLGVRQNHNEYDVYVHTSLSGDSKITTLYDVEFVTVCFSPDRLEKHRLMLTPKNEPPTATALKQSALIFRRMYHTKPSTAEIRQFFGQRPPSELISSNLGEYFPTAELHALEATIRNSVRQSIRLLRKSPFMGASVLNVLLGKPSLVSEDSSLRSSSHQRTIGDVLLHNVNMVDEAKNPGVGDNLLFLSRIPHFATFLNLSLNDDSQLAISQRSPYSFNKSRFSVATLYTNNTNRHSRIDVLNIDTDDDDKDDFLADYDNSSDEETDNDNAFKGRKWLQGARIGAGSFGTVYLGMDPLSGELMAVKQVPIPSGTSKQSEQARSMIAALQREMALLKELNHENIVLYYGLASDNNFLNIFLEYIPGGSVLLMLLLYGPFEEPLIRNFVRQVLVGLSYLHGVDIIHRDIKGANILIDIKGIAKISDFGISKKIETEDGEFGVGEEKGSTGKQAKRASLQGLVYWMAPEVVKQTAYTKKADIWSVGCLIVEMFTGKHPFPNFSQMQAIFKIGTHTRPEVPGNCTLEGQEFISRTFEFDYEKRPSAVDLLTEPFLTPLILSHREQREEPQVRVSEKVKGIKEEDEEGEVADAQSTFVSETESATLTKTEL